MTRPVCVLVAAMGGEGGGVLADWLIDASTHAGFPVQSTSVPGVAQRTGATTYYVEIFPQPRAALAGREPVLSLTPTPGQVDIVAASELVEAGRSIQSGYVDPQRTTLVTSTHREYAVSEKAAMGDGRFDSVRIIEAATQRARRAVIFDMRALAQQNGTVINTVMFGAMCAAGVLPFDRAACEEAIRRSGKAVDASLRGFAAGFDATEGRRIASEKLDSAVRARPEMPARVRALPESLHDVVCAGVALTTDFQDERYATLYLDRVEQLMKAAPFADETALGAVREAARYLALWMSYEDVVRVAHLKTRRERLDRVRREVGARSGEPLQMTEFLKPGLDEMASVLPPRLAAWLRRKAAGQGWHRGMYIRTDTIKGFLMLCGLRSLRPLRRHMSRYHEEQAGIEAWLAAVQAAMPGPLALEAALCGNLVKGYGETNRRGRRNLDAILKQIGEGASAESVRAARIAALADPEGKQLSAALGQPIARPIHIVRRRPAN
ncbi:indolepyruvate oxidoreductase subunit beta family protein [Variovorax sp. KK3]|uniref:indolepyruvate oxidoreductase subunit beta family protein n=1 Tax=Variovorax sp. KK3 TaxID=1855728 RepID=UPI00097C8E1C|nr:indolepyruvate oxidoreductase subunit beta family protein [Variovorax sp. KK3]